MSVVLSRSTRSLSCLHAECMCRSEGTGRPPQPSHSCLATSGSEASSGGMYSTVCPRASQDSSVSEAMKRCSCPENSFLMVAGHVRSARHSGEMTDDMSRSREFSEPPRTEPTTTSRAMFVASTEPAVRLTKYWISSVTSCGSAGVTHSPRTASVYARSRRPAGERKADTAASCSFVHVPRTVMRSRSHAAAAAVVATDAASSAHSPASASAVSGVSASAGAGSGCGSGAASSPDDDAASEAGEGAPPWSVGGGSVLSSSGSAPAIARNRRYGARRRPRVSSSRRTEYETLRFAPQSCVLEHLIRFGMVRGTFIGGGS